MKSKTVQNPHLSFKDEIIKKITLKLNNLISNEDFKKNWDYFFEPISMEKKGDDEKIFSSNFFNPFSKKNLKFWWKSRKNSRNSLQVMILEDLDEITLKEFHNALEHIEYQQNRKNQKKKLDYIDFFENETLLVIAIEVPNEIREEQIEIFGNTENIEVRAGHKFKKKISINTNIELSSAIAKFDNNILEIKLQKIQKNNKTIIPISKVR